MAIFTITQAKSRLLQLIARAEVGEEIIIARGKEPVVRLTPVASNKGKRAPGLLKDRINLPDEFFFAPLPENELRVWEGIGSMSC